MIVVDVNLLLYAVMTPYPTHPAARGWWERTLSSSAVVGLAAPAVFGFLRLATNPRVFDPPLAIDAAIGYVRGWLARPHVRYVVPGPRHLDIAFDLLAGVGTGGNLTTDVQLAALAIEQGGELHSNDSDFSRFPGLTWVNPLR